MSDEKRLPKAMTVAELIEELQNCSPDALVMFQYNYGDYGKTEVAEGVQHVDDETPVRWSEYHRMHAVLEDEDEDDDRRVVNVVMLS